MAPNKRIQLCFLETACTGSYMASGQWRSSTDNGKTKDRLKYYMELAKLAERGKISAIFLADWYVGFDVYGGGLYTMLASGHQVAHLDPVPIISAIAAVTETVSFAATVSTSYVNPYILARQFSTLDHLTDGRVGWNIVTSHTKGAAKVMGLEKPVEHDERYLVADEYMEVVYKLKIKKIEHKGKCFTMSGRSQLHPSPQRTPVLFQAGTSKPGIGFVARHAEAMFLNPCTVKQGKKVIAEARAAAAAEGRDPASLKFFPCIVPIIGRTEEEAKKKHEKALSVVDAIGGLAQFSGYTGIDMSVFPLDEPFTSSTLKGGASIQSVLNAFEASTDSSSMDSASSEPWTPRRLGMRMALGGLHPCPIGSVSQVADVFEEWITEADCDGFNVAYVSNPGSFEDVVDLLVPEL
ncbi:bacterial luciferase-like protein [Hyaloscypha variabilis F]|uniref:Bacterial luciferase-like protein n=1 Tax=Hyaloscypha variabilis (strain UAMH 11265 / GT02V1 / F) TaxID=1149755 RepID=A0A2J6QWL9_HYAVF|nr:bacterial luciferase-like protein [Hyaloscypha variabilis F]